MDAINIDDTFYQTLKNSIQKLSKNPEKQINETVSKTFQNKQLNFNFTINFTNVKNDKSADNISPRENEEIDEDLAMEIAMKHFKDKKNSIIEYVHSKVTLIFHSLGVRSTKKIIFNVKNMYIEDETKLQSREYASYLSQIKLIPQLSSETTQEIINGIIICGMVDKHWDVHTCSENVKLKIENREYDAKSFHSFLNHLIGNAENESPCDFEIIVK